MYAMNKLKISVINGLLLINLLMSVNVSQEFLDVKNMILIKQ